MVTKISVYPSQYDAARPWIVAHALYGIVGSIAAALNPVLFFGLMEPAFLVIERYTGLVIPSTSTMRKYAEKSLDTLLSKHT